MKRCIRLKERLISVKRLHTPTEEYKAMRPKLEIRDYYEETCEQGTIKTELSIESDNKVVLLGGSFVENLYADSKSRIASVFEKKLNQEGYDIKVINAGISGSTTLNLFNLFINKFLNNKPKVVFFFIPTNDGFCIDLKDGLWNKMKSYSNLYNIDFVSELDIANRVEKIKDIERIYLMLINTCKLFNIKLYICASPIIEDISDFYLASNEKMKRLNINRMQVIDRVLDICKEHGVDSIDLRDQFEDLKKLFFDDVHSNSYGSEKIAEYIFSESMNNYSFIDINCDEKNTSLYFRVKNDLILTENIFWSEPIFLDSYSYDAVLSFDIICSSDVGLNNALFCVDFAGKEYSIDECNLIFSPIVGSFQYLMTKKLLNCNIQHRFRIPINNDAIRIGFRLWNTCSKINISNVDLYLNRISL